MQLNKNSPIISFKKFIGQAPYVIYKNWRSHELLQACIVLSRSSDEDTSATAFYLTLSYFSVFTRGGFR
jgi:hypothetical protein